MRTPAAPSLLAFAVAALAASSAHAQSSTTSFGTPLTCPVALSKTAAPTLALINSPSFVVKPTAETWVGVAMKRAGFPAPLPTQGAARDIALRASTLLMNGNIVAAKMANDEAIATIPTYKRAAFSSSFESFLTASTQPVMHASYPSLVHAEGEVDAPRGTNTFGVDLERTSASLLEVIRRAGVSKHAMGPAYDQPAVRFYLLAHGFRDEVALQSATTSVCALGLSDAVRTKLDVSARFMAMPAAKAGEDVGSGVGK
jgi:hypothetical protein